MTRVNRSRPLIEVVTGSPGSREWWLGTTLLQGPVYANTVVLRKTMGDSVGPSDEDGPLDIMTARLRGGSLNGMAWSSFGSQDRYYNFGPENGALWRMVTAANQWYQEPSWATLALRARASLNPNTPTVDLPVFLAELRDLPKLYEFALRTAKGKNPNVIPEGNLVAQFGVIPLISDILKMFEFSEAVKKREDHLRRLAKGTERFSRKLDSYSYQSPPISPIIFTTRVQNISANSMMLSYQREAWFSARASAEIPSAGDIPRLSRDLVLGINSLSIKQLWELIPWSWLIDYFTNVGLILQAYRTGIPWSLDRVTIMVHDNIKEVEIPLTGFVQSTTVDVTAPRFVYDRKRREVVTPSPFAVFRRPYLTASQWSILASLLVLRNSSVTKIAS